MLFLDDCLLNKDTRFTNKENLRMNNNVKKWILSAKLIGHRIKEIIKKIPWIIPYVALVFMARRN